MYIKQIIIKNYKSSRIIIKYYIFARLKNFLMKETNYISQRKK